MSWEIEFYEDDKQNMPVIEFLLSLPAKEQAKANWTINLLERTGVNLTQPYVKHLEGALWELRTNNNRILYFLDKNVFVLLHGFKKKTMKLPVREKDIAVNRMEIYLKRGEENG